MTDNQRKNLNAIAQSISAGRASVSESFAAGQIQLVASRSWDQAIAGLKLMRSEKLLPEDFIKADTDGVINRLASRNPVVAKLFSRFDVVLGKCEMIPFEGFLRPKAADPERLKKIFSMPEF